MLTQLKMRYNLYSELSLQPQRSGEKHQSVPSCKSHIQIVTKEFVTVSTDPTCVLLAPRYVETLSSITKDRISAALATRYSVHKSIAKHHVPNDVAQWGKVRRVDGGNTMVAAFLGNASLDRGDATHIRVCKYIFFVSHVSLILHSTRPLWIKILEDVIVL